MKSLPYLQAASLALANLFLPELDAWLDAYRWTQTHVTSWMCSRKMAPTECRQG